MIEEYLIRLAESYPPWAVALSLLGAALSFLARHRAHHFHGRIREYDPMSVGVAATLAGLALLYVVIEAGGLSLAARPVVNRALLSLLGLALIAFNWGGVRATARDISEALGRKRS